MPFLLDLLTLLMEAGSTFLAALRQACDEFQGHPVAAEFGRVLADMNHGKTRTEALLAMRDRLADDEITSIIGSIVQGESLGTPLAGVFRTQADVLRIKRTQRAELLAGEAGVNMLLPAVLVMIATVLVILGPFLLNFLNFGLSL
jgi:tight adherence protein C